jgi:hypothetical protein
MELPAITLLPSLAQAETSRCGKMGAAFCLRHRHGRNRISESSDE